MSNYGQTAVGQAAVTMDPPKPEKPKAEGKFIYRTQVLYVRGEQIFVIAETTSGLQPSGVREMVDKIAGQS